MIAQIHAYHHTIDNSVTSDMFENATNLTFIGPMLDSLTKSIFEIGITLIGIKNALYEDFNYGITSDNKFNAINGDDGSSHINEGNDLDWKWQAYQEYKFRSSSTNLKKYGDN